MDITDEMVEAAAASFWETERWRFMESFESDLDTVKEHFRGRARKALEAALEEANAVE